MNNNTYVQVLLLLLFTGRWTSYSWGGGGVGLISARLRTVFIDFTDLW